MSICAMMRDGVKVKIYYIPGSHPCEAVFKAAELKNIEYKRVVVLPPAHRIQMTLMFGSRTVPAAKITGGPNGTEKIQTSRKIIRAFESINPDAPEFYPSDPAQRERVLAAEAWGDGDFQDIGRRLSWAHLARDASGVESFSEGQPVPLPKFMQRLAAAPMSKIQAKLNRADDESVKSDLAKLPEMLDQIDQYIADGVIGGEQPNAADLQILASLWLWRSMDDLRPAIDARPSGKACEALFGEPGGRIAGGILPAEWFEAVNRSLVPATA
ncbi:MAG: glutathione S-transferase [Solirubrobacterales bacterium]